MRGRIKKRYKEGFSSSPIDISEKEIDFIIKHECKCFNCEADIFEMCDFPEFLIKDDELLCEYCYGDKYRPACPICEDSYDIYKGESEYRVVTENDASDYDMKPGIYHNDKLILPIRINYFKSIECGLVYSPVYSDKICPDCAERMLRKSNYLKFDSTPCILLKQYSSCMPIKKMKFLRQQIVHRRITCRGLIDEANNTRK